MPAVAAVGALDVVVLALVGVLLLIAFAPLFRPLIQGLASLPIVGAGVAGAVEVVLAQGIGAAQGWAQWAVAPLADLFGTVTAVAVYFSGYTAAAAEQLGAALWRLQYLSLPAAVAQAEGYAAQLASQVLAYTVQAVAGAERYAELLDQQAVQYAQQLAQADQALAEQLAQQAEGYAAQLAAQGLAYTQAAVLDAEQLARAEVTAAEGYAAQLAAAGIAYTQAAVLGAEQLAEQLGSQAEQLARQLAGDVAAQAAAADAAVAAAGAAAVAAVVARVAEVEDSPCQRFCGPLGDLGALLQGLEDAGLLALLLALYQDAVQHPDQVAELVDGTVGAAGRDAVKALALGIPA